ncbi:MAG: hypothetical protein D6813_12445 [Calditrichaeota bacterium]|nr:MAG: hypothetical protein D6813_12445 [Calditrichota bacterium]
MLHQISLNGFMILVSLCLWLYLGCSSTHVLRSVEDTQLVQEIYNKSENRRAEIYLKDGKAFKAWKVQVKADSTTWLVEPYYRKQTLATSAVREVRIVDRGKGALLGLAIGAVPGFLLSILAQNCGECEGSMNVGFSMLFAGATGAIGLITGSVIGSKDIYEFSKLPVKTGDRSRSDSL